MTTSERDGNESVVVSESCNLCGTNRDEWGIHGAKKTVDYDAAEEEENTIDDETKTKTTK